MWYPCPLLIAVPCAQEAQKPSDMSYVSAPYLSKKEERKFLLNRSVFDLLKATQSLGLTDPKLLCWYLSLPAEDRRVIQEEGGLLQFLQQHPALEVARQFVFVKQQARQNCMRQQTMSSNLNKSRRPTFYVVTQCCNCGTSCSSGAKKCRRCSAPIQKEVTCSSGSGVRQQGALEQLEGGQFSVDSPVDPQVDLQDSSFQSACDTCTHISEEPTDQQEVNSGKAQLLSQLWEEGTWQDGNGVAAVCKDPSAQASFSLDMELEMHCQTGVEANYCQPSIQGQGMSVPVHEETVDFPVLEQETPPEYYSFNSTRLDRTQWNNTTSHSAESVCSDSLMATRGSAEEPHESSLASSCAEEWSKYCHSPESSDWTHNNCPVNLVNEDSLRRETENKDYHSIMEEDKSILMCGSNDGSPEANTPPLHGQTWMDQSGLSRGVFSALQTPMKEEKSLGECSFRSMSTGPGGSQNTPLTQSVQEGLGVQTPGARRDLTFSLSPAKATEVRGWSTADGSTNTLPPVAKHDVCVGTEQSLRRCHHTQTQGPSIAEKGVNTEVHMADLDYLTEEFIKMTFAQEELKELKEKMASSPGAGRGGGCDGEQGCDCAQRAKRAELCLLALQYGMCQQHCWRRYYTSPEGDRVVQGSGSPPETLMTVLQVLEGDYREMRGKVLSGVPLDQLKPLSVDSQTITTGTRYTPAQIIGESLGSVMPGASDLRLQHLYGEDGGDGGGNIIPPARSGECSQEGPRGRGPVTLPKAEGSIAGKAAALVPQHNGTNRGQKPGGGGGKDVNSSEAWFDAEEDLGPAGAAVKAETLAVVVEKTGEGAIKEGVKGHSSFLCVTDLPSHVTEGEVMLWFEKYQVSEVSISTVSNNLRLAIVTVSGPEYAEAAVKEMDGRSMQGLTVHVAHIHRPSTRGQQGQGEGQGQGEPTHQQGPFTRHRTAGPPGDAPGPKDSKISSKTSQIKVVSPMVSQPLSCSPEKRTTISDSPTASGTCVPQHYATMGSFDTLMARLSERHPEVGRQRIVDALLELRAKHQGFLSGLPLRTIVEMTSDLLMQPPSVI